MGNVPDKSFRENQNTHFMINNLFKKKSAVYKIMCKNVLQPGRPQNTYVHNACWISKATDTHTKVV
jgi:hypothetical protein